MNSALAVSSRASTTASDINFDINLLKPSARKNGKKIARKLVGIGFGNYIPAINDSSGQVYAWSDKNGKVELCINDALKITSHRKWNGKAWQSLP